MSDYPGAIDTFRSPDNLPGNAYNPANTTTIYSEDFSTRSDAIIAIEETLGVNPQGSEDTVADRITAVESLITSIKSQLMPVGTLYFNKSNSTNPATLLGFGTWTQITDKMIMAVGSTYPVNTSGGAATHAHPLSDNGHAQTGGGTSNNIYRNITVASYTYNRLLAGTGSSSSAATTTGVGLGGNTDNASSLPPYETAYVWRRTA